MIPVTSLPLAALTLMLWLLWSDSVRRTRPHAIVYVVRALLFVAASGVMLYNRFHGGGVRYTAFATILVFFAAAVGLLGAAFFIRKALMPPGYRPAARADEEMRLHLGE